MAPSIFELNTYCDADNAPEGFRHTPETKKLCKYCGRKNPQYQANIPATVIEQVDLTDSPDTQSSAKGTPSRDKPPRPTQRIKMEREAPGAMTTQPLDYVHGEGERQRQESIRLQPSKKNKPTVIEPTVILNVSVHRMSSDGNWLSQKCSRLVTVPNDEYDYRLLIFTCISKLRTASHQRELRWLTGDLEDWQIATQAHQKGFSYPTTVYYEGKKRLSHLLTKEWGLQPAKNTTVKQYRLFLYYSTEGGVPEEVESESDALTPVKKAKSKAAMKEDEVKASPKLDNVKIKREKVKEVVKEKESHKRGLSSAEHPYSTRSRPKLKVEDKDGLIDQGLPIRSGPGVEEVEGDIPIQGQESEDDLFSAE
jgi:hypothetical protein